MQRIKNTLLFLLLVFRFYSQETGYLIRNFPPKEYNGFNQVWSAVQDSNGVLYFGTSSNIVTFNGKKWDKIEVKKGLPIRSLQLHNGKIYVGTESDFGYLDRGPDLKPHYVSLISKLKKEQLGFTDVWKIMLWKDKLVFHCNERIFIYDGKQFTTVEPPTSFALAFVTDERLFVRQRKIGMMEVMSDGSLRLIKGGEYYQSLPVIGFTYDAARKCFVVGGSEHGVLLYDEKTGITKTIDEKLNSRIRELFPLTLTRGDENNWFLTSRVGFIVLDDNFNILRKFDKQSGIYDDVVTGTFFSGDGNLWLTLNNGISMIEWNSGGMYLTEKSGIKGGVEDMLMVNGLYYFATTHRVFTLPYENAARGDFSFKELDSEVSEYWDLERSGEKVFAAATSGLYLIKDGRSEKISPFWTRYILKLHDTLPLFVALQKNCITFLDVNTVPMVRKEILIPGEEFNHGLLQREGNAYRLWAITPGGKLFRFLLDSEFNLKEQRLFTEKNGYKTNFQHINCAEGTIFFSTPDRICIYRPEKDRDSNSVCFEQVNYLSFETEKEFSLENNFSGRVFIGPVGTVFAQKQKSGKYLFKPFSLKQSVNEFTCYVTDDSLRTWFFTPEFIVLQKHSHDSKIKENFPVNITYFKAGKDSSRSYYGYPPVTQFNYRDNSFYIEYSAAFFTESNGTLYRCRLTGSSDTSWTAWTTGNRKEYTNLHEGDYEFCVQAKNVFGDVSEAKSLRFSVLPPWYRTMWAYTAYAVALIFLVFSVNRISNYRLQQSKIKLEKLVNERTHELQEKKKEVTDSIKYALRIQTAILPPDSYFKRLLPDSFTFYRPKDIVSGDFYWVDEIRGKVLFAAVDCTGHGVPGAMMSVIGLRLLNSAVNDRRLDTPSDILHFLDRGVHETLRQGEAGSGVKDGMDLALCTWDKAAGVLEYAGVFNSLWLVRKNIASTWKIKSSKEVLFGEHLLEIKPDKMSIGNNEANKADQYTNHYIKLQKGDCVFIYSDGYADQFGGPAGKKFKYNKLKELLVTNAHLSMDEQHKILSELFDRWKGSNEQIDDVLVMGIRV